MNTRDFLLIKEAAKLPTGGGFVSRRVATNTARSSISRNTYQAPQKFNTSKVLRTGLVGGGLVSGGYALANG